MDRLIQIFDSAHLGVFLTQLHADLQSPAFWLAVAQIIWINVLLSGDNALVIAMACRGLQPRQRLWGLILGAAVAVLLRVIFTGIVATLMSLPYLKLIGGAALMGIAAKLLVPENPEEDEVAAAAHLWAAVRIVAIADIVMSLDNVIAVAAAAKGSVVLLVLGLVISIPMIVAGAAMIMWLLNRLPVLVWAGSALLGWIAGDVMATDPVVEPTLHQASAGGAFAGLASAFSKIGVALDGAEIACAIAAMVIVLAIGTWWRKRVLARHADLREAG